MMANPPYGVTWKKDKNYIENEALNPAGRFYAGTPRTSDGQLLFLQHMISKMDEKNGSRIGVVTNGSPLFTGDAGSGESNIRKWIIENDWLECIVALPKDLFYNTGINTYIWFLTNKKSKERKGKVQLINANASKVTGTNAKGKEETEHIFARSNKKSLGNKRNELTQEHIKALTDIYTNFEENEYCKIYNNDDFGFYQLTIEQPLYKDGKKVLSKGNPKPDSKKRDKENVPLTEDIESYFTKEVLPHVPEAWIDYDKTRIGYEINFTKYFYEYKGLQPASEIKADIIDLEKDIAKLLNDLLV
jgi:type I restriction enzyme M protein